MELPVMCKSKGRSKPFTVSPCLFLVLELQRDDWMVDMEIISV
jgi:hypothetical protein